MGVQTAVAAGKPRIDTERTILLRREADRCVKCGLCVGTCPTYRHSQDEGESPRGRIALIQALAESKLDATPRMTMHLQSCLECLACETVCPSEVRFSTLMDGARAEIHERQPWWRRGFRAALLAGLSHRGLLRFCASLLRLLSRSPALQKGLVEILMQLRVPGAQLIPELGPGRETTQTTGKRGGAGHQKVQIFTGCVTSIADARAIDATVRVLTGLGYEVEIPDRQTCCGAMHVHNGLPVGAARRAKANLAAFEDPMSAPILAVASGCATTLRAATELSGAEPGFGDPFGGRVLDVSDFLDQCSWPESVALNLLSDTVLVHDPCSLRNGLRRASSVYRLVARIPGVGVEPLDGNDCCCGAAGTYLLTQPAMSQRLLERKLDAIRRCGAKLVLTSNTGCALHLKAGIRAAGLSVEVIHPVELIERQLRIRRAD